MSIKRTKVRKGEVDRWAQQARLDLPDRWPTIRGHLERPQPTIRDAAAHRPAVQTRRRWVLAANGILLVVLAITLLSVLHRPSEPSATTAGATYAAGTTTRAGMMTTGAGTTGAGTTAATTVGTTQSQQTITYPVVSSIGSLSLYQTATSLSDDPGVTVHHTQIDLQMEGKYQIEIVGVDDDWNLLVHTYLGSGVGQQPDPDVPTYEYGLYNLQDKTYHRLFRLDARHATIPDWPSQYSVYTDPSFDGEYVVFAECVRMQTERTHANLSLYRVSTGETATYVLDQTLNEFFDGDAVAVRQVLLIDGNVFFSAMVYHDEDMSLNHRALYRLNIETGECVRIMTFEGGTFLNMSGRLAWMDQGEVRYVDDPASITSVVMPDLAWNEQFWSLERYTFTLGPWIDSDGLLHVPEGNTSIFSHGTVWVYRDGIPVPVVGIADSGVDCWIAGDYLVIKAPQDSLGEGAGKTYSYTIYDMTGDKLITMDGLPGDLSKVWTAGSKLALAKPYQKEESTSSSQGELYLQPLDGRLVADVYWIDLNDLK